MGTGGGARPRQAQNAAQPHQGLPIVSVLSFFLLLSGLLYQEALSGSRTAEHTMQQPGKQKATSSVQVVSITSSILVSHIIPQLAPGGGHVK